MARKKRQRISYVLPLASSPGGHRLGINGLAVDQDQSILYSGGRDGVICSWDLNFPLKPPSVDDPFASSDDPLADSTPAAHRKSTFRHQVQAHTHWVNDIVLAQNNSALISASSDVTVKLWSPHSDNSVAQTIGTHTDYVKCLATPEPNADWVASGGLDHKICIWDLNGAGEKLQISVNQDESVAKGSVYTLSARGSILASGGPESTVRVWDPKAGKSITKLVGHTDNVRSILISEDGNTILSASSDQTVKVWSMTAGRCMHTLTMHNDSVWSLYSDDPRLAVFYSSDRSGMVVKTDCRSADEMDGGLSVAICQEHEGVDKVIAAGGHIWTATANSSINRWKDVDTQAEIEEPQDNEDSESSSASRKSEDSSNTSEAKSTKPFKIPYNSILGSSVTSLFPSLMHKFADQVLPNSGITGRRTSGSMVNGVGSITVPVHHLPEESIEGQNGLIKHVMLNDRKRVLTLDTAGEVILWDLLKCVPIKSFGKHHLDDIIPEVNTIESVANWCTVDTRTGKLSVMLEENYCFDAEVYADEIRIDEKIDFRDDQRINLGKWVLRNLFTHFIDEEIRRDEAHRKELLASFEEANRLKRENAPSSIALPSGVAEDGSSTEGDTVKTPKPNGLLPSTTGLSIGIATPGALQMISSTDEDVQSQPKTPGQSILGTSAPRSSDYFSSTPNTKAADTPAEGTKAPVTPGETPASPTDADGEKRKGLFGKKFQMTFPKKLSRNSVEAKPPPAEEKAEESDKSSEKEEKVFDDNISGVVQKIRHEYDEQFAADSRQSLIVGITPSLPNETPVLKLPAHTQILIQEDSPESGGAVDLYRGTISTQTQDTDTIEKVGPTWLGELLLRNLVPYKDVSKTSFVLNPYGDELPSIANLDGNARLNANRMLRAKKILSYVAERIEPAPEQPDPNALRPDEYLELYCQGQLVHPNTTLATLRVHIWRTGGDIILYYKANGKKQIKGKTIPHPAEEVAAREREREENNNNNSDSNKAPETGGVTARSPVEAGGNGVSLFGA
ncbi:putative wd repeat protein [Phaeomoniella chlamydospora]|uniref:Putative wd repeat protein n=1 Tax=Phaeomoniella chlamydospora TaxID=158046 RepID=A0A0G2EZZ7_PHACM|nr:putative wd repeat protein [Phaeomoniella chlamydospora]